MHSAPADFIQRYLYLSIFIIPVVMLLIGAFGKKVARGKGWRRTDFALGADLTLTVLSLSLINVLDIAKEGAENGAMRLLMTVFLVVCCFCFFTINLAWQQEHEVASDGASRGQVIWLLGASNLVGLGLMVAFLGGRLKGYL